MSRLKQVYERFFSKQYNIKLLYCGYKTNRLPIASVYKNNWCIELIGVL